MTKQTKLSFGAVLAVAIAISSCWYFSPYWALHELNVAIQNNDAKAFNQHVDFPSLRESLKVELGIKLSAVIGETAGKPSTAGVAFGVTLATSMMDQVVDAMIQPATLMTMMRIARVPPSTVAPARSSTSSVPAPQNSVRGWTIQRESADRVLAYAPENDSHRPPEDRLSVTIRREGFAEWKLVAIRLPRN